MGQTERIRESSASEQTGNEVEERELVLRIKK